MALAALGCAISYAPHGYYHIAAKNGSRTDTIRNVSIRAELNPSRDELGPLRIETMFPSTKPMPSEIRVRWTSADGVAHDVMVPIPRSLQPTTSETIAFMIQQDGGVSVFRLSKEDSISPLLADRMPRATERPAS